MHGTATKSCSKELRRRKLEKRAVAKKHLEDDAIKDIHYIILGLFSKASFATVVGGSAPPKRALILLERLYQLKYVFDETKALGTDLNVIESCSTAF